MRASSSSLITSCIGQSGAPITSSGVVVLGLIMLCPQVIRSMEQRAMFSDVHLDLGLPKDELAEASQTWWFTGLIIHHFDNLWSSSFLVNTLK